ncbi:MAG: DUF4271 domain-containing protein [Cytophagales bacterium]|nr:DUF4271 domain-containing protein [Cytophagales bacterium]
MLQQCLFKCFLPFFFAIALSASAQEGEGLLSKSYLIDPASQKFEPNLKLDWSRVTCAGYYVNTQGNSADSLFLEAPLHTAVFLGKRLLENTSDSVLKYSVSELRRKADKDSVFLTFFNPSGLEGLRQVPQVNRMPVNRNLVRRWEKSSLLYRDFFVVGFMLNAFLFALIRRYSHNQFSLVAVDSLMRGRKVSSLSFFLPLLLLFSFIVGFLLFGIKYGVFGGLYAGNGDSFPELIQSWIFWSVCVFVFVGLKFVIVKYSSVLFNLKGVEPLHLIAFFRFALVFSVVGGGVILVYIFGGLSADISALFDGYSMPLILVFVVLLSIYITILRKSNYDKLHLFSYLCVCELIPMLVGVKLFLDY